MSEDFQHLDKLLFLVSQFVSYFALFNCVIVVWRAVIGLLDCCGYPTIVVTYIVVGLYQN
jgi:hypothetical protein